MTSALVKHALYPQQNDVLHHLATLIASGSDNDTSIVRVTELWDSHLLSTERRHELAQQVTDEFAQSSDYQPYTVVYVEQLGIFLGIDLVRL